MASVTLRCGAVAVVLLLSQAVQAGEDAHDKLVYSRYSKKVQPTAYKLNRDKEQYQLDRPATKKSVEAGDAIFSFEGLGEARVWKLPGEGFSETFPVTGQWPVLATPRQSGNGEVCQAEDLKVNDKWKRYFGFVYYGRAAVVPAEEIELLLFYAPWHPRENLLADMFWGLTVPGPKPGFWKRQADETPKVGDPLLVGFHVRNTTDRPQEFPSTWYQDAQHGGPAILDVASLSLQWAPFDPNYPVRRKFVELEPIRSTHFPPDTARRTVKPGESCELLAFDLRDWFKADKEGYYLVSVKIDWKSLGLHDKLYQNLECRRDFSVGKPPKLPSIKAFNKTLPPLGVAANEERLKRLIKESIRPKPVDHKPLAADVERLLAWSDPVGGLAARIEDICDWRATTVLVRLKNASQRPLVVPTGNPRDKNAARAFEVYVRQGAGPWRQADPGGDPYCERSAPPRPSVRQPVARQSHEDDGFAYRAADVRGLEADRPLVTLQPGEHCLAFVRAYDKQNNGQPKEFKVVLRQPQASAAGHWTGVLETPPRFAPQTLVQPVALTGALPMPEHFPAFTYAFTGINWNGQEPAVKALWYSNRELFDLLPVYDPAGVRKEFERRTRTETRLPVKLLLAVVAARAGSEEAGLFFLETMKDTDYRTCVNVHGALAILFPYSPSRTAPPDWVVELSMAALADNRFVTGLDKTNWGAGTSFTVASCETGYLEGNLCYSKCRKALPLLIERLKKGQSGSYSAAMLGEMGDQRAIPFLIETVEAAGKSAKYSKEYGLSEEFSRPAYDLAELKAREAVPLLLRYIEFPEIISDLGEIGDPRAAPVLREACFGQRQDHPRWNGCVSRPRSGTSLRCQGGAGRIRPGQRRCPPR